MVVSSSCLGPRDASFVQLFFKAIIAQVKFLIVLVT